MSTTDEHDTTEATENLDAPSTDVVESAASAPVAPVDADEITRTLDRLSLTQALVDFELANARVLDLTARLVEANERVARQQGEADALRAESDALRGAVAAAQGELASLRASRSHRLAQRLATIAGALRKG